MKSNDGDLISRKALLKEFGIDDDTPDVVKILIAVKLQDIEKKINEQPTACDTENELRLLKNYLYHKSKAYRQRNANYVVVRDLLMANTSHAGMTSCVMECYELGIDPYGYDLKGAVKDENALQSI